MMFPFPVLRAIVECHGLLTALAQPVDGRKPRGLGQVNRAANLALQLALVSGVLVGCSGVGAVAASEVRDDRLIADFEGEDYAGWIASGTAFGSGPAHGTLPGQMDVSGFEGRGLVNSFLEGDGATGRLRSPAFTIDRPYLNFLIGGGRHPGQTELRLLINDQIVRSASGPNSQPGGSERLQWQHFDVQEFAGQPAAIEIIDEATGGWGHINVDSIALSDSPATASLSREIAIEHRWLIVPVQQGSPQKVLRVNVGDRLVSAFDVELAEDRVDYHTFLDVSAFRGQSATITAEGLPRRSAALARLETSDTLPDETALYAETHRPTFHFTSRRGWLNDPNGLVFDGQSYHLYYQHNPYGWNWGNMHWGHARSTDMVRWTEQPIALTPPRYGDMAFSGSAVVDHDNTSGFAQPGDPPLLVAAFTSTGRGECIAFSRDRGQSWQEFAGNPVIRHQGRDPRLLWYAPGQHWVMALYDEAEGQQWINFYTSTDLKDWSLTSRIAGFYECPDLFELPVRHEQAPARLTTNKSLPLTKPTVELPQSLWVLLAADGKYVAGSFDGHVFRPRSQRTEVDKADPAVSADQTAGAITTITTAPAKQQVWFGNFYAAQTFTNLPNGRVVQIGWGQGVSFPGQPFNQQMTIACDLSLVARGDQLQLRASPVPELDGLSTRTDRVIDDGRGLFPQPLMWTWNREGRCRLKLVLSRESVLRADIRGIPIEINRPDNLIRCRHVTAPLPAQTMLYELDLLVDRGSAELFVNGGEIAISAGGLLDPENDRCELSAPAGTVRLESLEVQDYESIWKTTAAK